MLDEAVAMLVEATRMSPIDFRDVDQLAIAATPDARYALGLIEGAAVVRGMTSLELLDLSRNVGDGAQTAATRRPHGGHTIEGDDLADCCVAGQRFCPDLADCC
ncbi:MAG TPA: hypothetical protein VM261_05050 [Kofleriaceae bacterium]|nr:hypothetical protein [Kofleriaceae bacterium]